MSRSCLRCSGEHEVPPGSLGFPSTQPFGAEFPCFRGSGGCCEVSWGYLALLRTASSPGLVRLFGMGLTTGEGGRMQLLPGNDCQSFPAVPEVRMEPTCCPLCPGCGYRR